MNYALELAEDLKFVSIPAMDSMIFKYEMLAENMRNLVDGGTLGSDICMYFEETYKLLCELTFALKRG